MQTVIPGQFRLRLTLLGRMQAQDATGSAVLPRSRKASAVLAVLALAAPRPVLRDDLTKLLWSRRDREQARASLRQCVHDLHKTLQPMGGDLLAAERKHLALRLDGVWIDARAAATAANPLDDPLLEDLVGLDPAFDTWLQGERRRLARGAAAAALSGLERGTADPALAIARAERLLANDATNEAVWRSLITAHAARGEHAAAIAAYARCAAALAEAADIAPAAETQALLAAIRRAASSRTSVPAGPARSHGASLGVLPFGVLSPIHDDPLPRGLADEITAALTRFRWIYLIAPPKPREDGAPWPGPNVDFLLDGTVQREDKRVRVQLRLLDQRADGEIAWAGRFDRQGVDPLTLQDEIAAETVARIDLELLLREGRRAAARPATNATAYELTLRALPALFHLEHAPFLAAGAALAAAVRLDPDYPAAHAWWACWHIFLVGQGWADDPPSAMARAGELAERAIRLDPADARGLAIAGHVQAFLHRRVEHALDLHERALVLNPNLPLAWALSGLALVYAGRHEEAIHRIQHARRLSPLDPQTFFFDMALMMPHLLLGRFETVLEIGRRALTLNPGLTSTYKGMLSALGHLGRLDEAAEIRTRLLALDPSFGASEAADRSSFLRERDNAMYTEGLRLAGLRE